MRKIIFLDIDGVLNSSRSVLGKCGPTRTPETVVARAALDVLIGDLPFTSQYALDTVDPVAVAMVNRLIRETGAEVVLSSTHRNNFLDDCRFGDSTHMNFLSLYLRAMGLIIKNLDVTPMLYQPRGAEVDDWLEKRGQDVDKYVIIDDSLDFSSEQIVVRVDAIAGFSDKNFYDAAQHLGIDVSPILF